MKRIAKNIEWLFSAITFAEAGEQEAARSILHGDRSIVLALTRELDASQSVAYTVNAARRNNARLDILFIDEGHAGNGPDSMENFGVHREMIGRSSVPFREIACAGPVQEVLREHARREKDILFFVVDPAAFSMGSKAIASASMNRFAEKLGRPIVQVESNGKRAVDQMHKEIRMSSAVGKQKPVGKMLVMGLISIALYTCLLSNQDLVNGIFGKGGLYALMPIFMAFVFSFVHGTFTSDFWTVLGIEAARKKKEVK